MAIITESELEVRLNHVNNAAKGRTKGANGIPDSLRSIIGFQAHFETAKKVASDFGVAPITAHLAKESRGNSESREAIQERLGSVRDIALDKMLRSLGVITEEKIDKLSVRGALNVAKGMAEIVNKTVQPAQITNNQVIIYSPAQRLETDYDQVIEVEKIS